jgi:hypothetical protein
MRFRDNAAQNGCDDLPIERHPDVVAGLEQVWLSNIGAKYLVANPVLVPALRPILISAVSQAPTGAHLSCRGLPRVKGHCSVVSSVTGLPAPAYLALA